MGELVVFALAWLTLALILVLVSGGFGLSQRIGRRWYRMRLARLARRSRLFLHSGALRVTGWLDGNYVVAWRDDYSAHVAIRIWPSLELGLWRQPHDQLSGSEYMQLVIHQARDRARSRFLFEGELWSKIARAPFDVEVFDEWLLVSDGFAHRFRKLPDMLRLALDVAELVTKRRKRLAAPAARSPLSAAVSELGVRHLLAPLGTPLGYEGNAFGANVAVFVRRDGLTPESACVVAKFREPLEIGFCAERGRFDGGAWWGQEKLTLGEAAFDERYTVSASETEYVQQALSRRARERLCEMADRWHRVRVDDYGISIESDTATAAELEEICTDAARAAELVDFVHPRKLANPYR